MNTRIYCTTQGTQPTFYNNYKWNITFKIVNHYVIHLKHMMLDIDSTSIKKKVIKKKQEAL